MKKKVRWITETAVLLALLIAVQGLTAGLGNQFVTGSCINLILAVAAALAGLWSSAAIAVLSPFLASLLGLGPKFVQLLPAVALGNLVYALFWYAAAGRSTRTLLTQTAYWLGAAAAKFLTLYLLMTRLLEPALVRGGTVPEKAAQVLKLQFSWPQLITALIGGALALAVLPALQRALHRT